MGQSMPEVLEERGPHPWTLSPQTVAAEGLPGNMEFGNRCREQILPGVAV